jgi:hypothetical protein
VTSWPPMLKSMLFAAYTSPSGAVAIARTALQLAAVGTRRAAARLAGGPRRRTTLRISPGAWAGRRGRGGAAPQGGWSPATSNAKASWQILCSIVLNKGYLRQSRDSALSKFTAALGNCTVK